ncbi:serine/threonine protein phosphatase [Candidatus Dependentiae bacterium]|nr:serine/threonine protein phosphatase [Candidatus Dependentiae bacterium]
MQRIILVLWGALIVTTLGATAITETVSKWHTTVTQHQRARKHQPLIDATTAINTINSAIKQRLGQLQQQQWLGTKNFVQQFFVEKRIVKHATTVVAFGDLHGDVVTLTAALHKLVTTGQLQDNWHLQPGVMLMFLGDYVDRGNYGIEVLYTICKLFIENPNQVICVRGNHEDVTLNQEYGFLRELQGKYETSGAQKIIQHCGSWYKVLPVALYLGCPVNDGKTTNYILCCHGCIDLGFNPKKLLATDGESVGQSLAVLAAADILSEIQGTSVFHDGFNSYLGMSERTRRYCSNVTAPSQCIDIGFMWNDCTALGDERITQHIPGRKISIGSNLAKLLIEHGNSDSHQLRGIIRGHQHNASMPQLLLPANKGRYRLPWDYPIDTIVSTNLYTPVPTMLHIVPSSLGWFSWCYTTISCLQER